MISVCMATHNGEKYITEQINSILCQLSKEDELIISDDGSTDKTISLIKSYNDSRIRLITLNHTKKNKKAHYYVSRNFENALKNAKGDYIYLSDQDAVWYPNKIEVCQKILQHHQAILHNLEYVDSLLNPLGVLCYNKKNKFRKHNYIMLGMLHMGCALAFRRELLNVVLPFPNDLHIHDFWIGIFAERNNGLFFLKDPLIKYRIHNLNTSGAGNVNNSLVFKIYYRIYTLFYYIIRYFKINILC